MRKTQLLAQPHDITRLGNLADAFEMGWAKIPVWYHYAFQVQLPMTEAEFNRLFVQNFRLFLQNFQEEACPGIVTNADFPALITTEPFLLMGVGVLAMGEGLSFCQDGALVTDAQVDAFGSFAPGVDSCLRRTAEEAFLSANTSTPAKHWYGGPTWRLIEKFFQMKRFVLRIGRCAIIDESLFELGMLYTPPALKGAGDSCVPTMPFIRETNDVMNGKSIGFKFLPPNYSSVERCVAGSLSCVPAVCAPNANVTYGHPVIPNLANRIYCLPQPIMITPWATRVDLDFETVDNDCCLIPAARKAAMLTQETPVEGFPARTGDGATTTVATVPGGCVTLGIILKGFTCLPQVVAQYLCEVSPSMAPVYANDTYVAGIIQKHGLYKEELLKKHESLRGLIGGLQQSGALSRE